ncbi:PDZ domain-containing protein [Clostridium sp. OF09-36]|uniref:S1C family serine protease n=1 Tax=Clostridium sp. OF09-36 TaxID=2292310 RepID=UPI000E502670|nr:PDZ domain-containing protein [Clostridium sp. OF09-36]RHV86101.1 PDZ domain-containing protein [Clostridium sp. OF09-36]
MSEVRDPEKKPEHEKKNDRDFISEKIVRPAPSKKQVGTRMATAACAGIIFGVVSAVCFVLTRPIMEQLSDGNKPTASAVSIPKDELESSVEAQETESASETETEPVEEMVQSALEHYRYTVDDLNSLLNSLRSKALAVDKSVVVVHSVQQNTDWFDNPVETTGLYAGVIIAKTSQELLILTPEDAVEQADSIKVTFENGNDVSGHMKQKDTTSGMAIVSVSAGDISTSLLKDLEPVPLGNSYQVRQGDMIASIGSPAGVVHSLDYGFVSYVVRSNPMVDQHCRMLYSHILTDADRGTFLMNTDGELIGWAVSASDSSAAGSNMAEIFGISDYKGILEKLSNGQGVPCVGIVGQEVTEVQMDGGMPAGIYVMNAVTEKPAYNAGIQNGDILTQIDKTPITSMKEYQAAVEKMTCGQTVHITVQRNGRDSYTQLEFDVTVGSR